MQSHIASVNGSEMFCEVQGEGDPLVLLHGFTPTGSDWRFVFKYDELGDAKDYFVKSATSFLGGE